MIATDGGGARRAGRALATTLALVLVACSSGGSSASPSSSPSDVKTVGSQEYIDGLCTAMSGWLQSIQDGNDQLQTDIQTIKSPAEAKDVIVAYLDDVVTASEQLVTEVEGLGVPDVDGGEEAGSSIVDVLTGVRDTMADARDQIDALDTSDPQAMVQALQQVATDLNSATGELIGPLARMSIPELEQAYADSSACDPLKSAGE